jgi:asparagine synthase (glutamine-hydrolysing)
MCGISGLISENRIDREVVVSMSAALSHRGPDADGVFLNSDATVALAHRRLSIIDLSSAANQPFISSDGVYAIVFNGEIYNYRSLQQELLLANPAITFRTHSDTEVVLLAFIQWGTDACAKLDGMFAFAIYNQGDDEIFLCRDRIGKKPLFYFDGPGLFAFASEIKSLLEHPVIKGSRSINQDAMYTFLHVGYIPEPETPYANIWKFPAGHLARMKKGSPLTILPYAMNNHLEERPDKMQENDVKAEVKAALMQAVTKRLMSDVPLGAFLSGGTDSSLVTAMAAQANPSYSLKTFSIGFKENKFDESTYARKVAAVLKTDHSEYILHESEAAGLLEQYIKHMDEPFADTSSIPTMVVSKLARTKVSVALTGDGGDELFLGYGSYDWANRLDRKWLSPFQGLISNGLKKIGNSRLKRIGFLLQPVGRDEKRSHIFSQEQYFFSRSEIDSMARKSTPLFKSLEYSDPEDEELTSAEKQALFDLRYYLKDNLLVKVDRSSMFYGLECRCPFLDPKVISIAHRLPYGMKKKGSERKWILKQILADYLPTELVYRAKRGFSIPLDRWLKSDLAYLIDSYLSESTVNDIGLVDYRYVRKLKRSFSNGDDFLYNRLWVLIVAHKWIYDNIPKL